jgi:hypothetical protein
MKVTLTADLATLVPCDKTPTLWTIFPLLPTIFCLSGLPVTTRLSLKWKRSSYCSTWLSCASVGEELLSEGEYESVELVRVRFSGNCCQIM